MEAKRDVLWDVLIGLAFAGTLAGVHEYFGRVYPQLLQVTMATGVDTPMIARQAEQAYVFVVMFLWVWMLLFLAVVVLTALGWIPHAVFRLGTGVITVFLGGVLIVSMLSTEKTFARELPPAIQQLNVLAGERSTIYLLYDIRKVQRQIAARGGSACSMDEIKARVTPGELEHASSLRFYYMPPVIAFHDIEFVDCGKKTDRVAIFPHSPIAPTASFCVGPSGSLHHDVLDETKPDVRKKFIDECD